MNSPENQELIRLIDQFQACIKLKHNGRLEIKSSQGKAWNLYYQFGQIVWATGGIHPYRRWQRNISQHLPFINVNHIDYDQAITSLDYWDYFLFIELYNNNIIEVDEINKIIASTIKEILFDLYQQVNYSTFTYERKSDILLDITILSTSNRMLIKQTHEDWNNWIVKGLSHISPCLSPFLKRPEQLHQQTSSVIYRNFERLMNGKHSLWDLSAKMNQSILDITCSLVPYIRQGIIELKELADLPLPFDKLIVDNANKLDDSSQAPLIACVDDNLDFCKLLEEMIICHGMKFISFTDPVQALKTLILTKPDLIFVDLMMPTMNGYELCAQLRSNPIFVDIPIVIITSSDNAFDKARSKVYGATEFMNKSSDINKIFMTINKYLGTTISG